MTVRNVIPKHLEATVSKLLEIGCRVEQFDTAVRVIGPEGSLSAANVKTLPYPGYPTDMQPQIGVALSMAEGTSIVTGASLRTGSNTWMSWPAWAAARRSRGMQQSSQV